MPETIGPVQILAVGFREGARFEGRIAEQIDLLEQSDTIRVLDFVFLHRDESTGALVRMDFDGQEGEGRVTMLLEGADTNGDERADRRAVGRLPPDVGRHPRRRRGARPRARRPASSSSSTCGRAVSSRRSSRPTASRSPRAS